MAEALAPGKKLSIIVPVYNEAPTIVSFLQQLRPWRELAEIIVVDGGSADATAQLASTACDRVLHNATGRAAQMNLGAAQAQSDYLLFLHCDTQLRGSPADFSRRLAALPCWGFFRVALSGKDYRLRLIEQAMNLRSSLTRVATGDQGIFVRRCVWLELGGYAEIPLMEDVELSKRLRRLSAPEIVSPGVITSSRRWEHYGVWATVFKMWRLRLAYWLGADPRRLARIYHA
jgi:rSAM/selenodomain-associated transferase 2